MKKYFITSTGTDIGKTHFITSFIKEIIAYKKTVKAIKPILTGLDYDNIAESESDSANILKVLGKSVNLENIQEISPFTFKTPSSPDIAAKIEKKAEIDYKKLSDYCFNFLETGEEDYALIEGIGGIMVPINRHKTILDLIKELDIEIILICGNYLGTISHSLNVLEICQMNNLKVKMVFLNNYPNLTKKDLLLNKESIENHTKHNLITPFSDNPYQSLLEHRTNP